MNSESMWKDAPIEQYPCTFLEGLRKTISLRIASLQTEVFEMRFYQTSIISTIQFTVMFGLAFCV
jgi:hypothetical protein